MPTRDPNVDWNVEIASNNMEYYGPTVAERPEANTVPCGATYVAVNSQEAWQSNGTTWVVI